MYIFKVPKQEGETLVPLRCKDLLMHPHYAFRSVCDCVLEPLCLRECFCLCVCVCVCVWWPGSVLLCDLPRPGDDQPDVWHPALLLLDAPHAHHVVCKFLFSLAAQPTECSLYRSIDCPRALSLSTSEMY